jgi:hypothetical protein
MLIRTFRTGLLVAAWLCAGLFSSSCFAQESIEDTFQRFDTRTVYGVALEVRENRVVDTFDSTDDTAYDAPALWEHRTSYFAEFLYLHPRGIDMAHAMQQAGTGGAGTTPFGRVGVLDPGAEAGIRTGFNFCLDSCSSLAATFSHFESTARDSLDMPTTPGMNGTVGSLVHHPGASLIGSAGPVTAAYGVDFDTVDFDYRRLICGGEDGYLNYSLGVRYGRLEQNFVQQGTFAGAGGAIRTTTDIDFDGVGIRFGLDGERRIGCGAWTFYGKSSISALAGEYRSDYLMLNTTGSVVLANSVWHDDRFTTVLDYELGLAWRDRCNRWRLSVGYTAAFWFNAVTTPEFIRAVQNSNFVDLGDTVSFDGLTARVEYQW